MTPLLILVCVVAVYVYREIDLKLGLDKSKYSCCNRRVFGNEYRGIVERAGRGIRGSLAHCRLDDGNIQRHYIWK